MVRCLREGGTARANADDFGDPPPRTKKVLQLWFSACGSDEASSHEDYEVEQQALGQTGQHLEVVKEEMKDERDKISDDPGRVEASYAKDEMEEGGEEDDSHIGIVTHRRRGGRSRSRYNRFWAGARQRTPTP